MKFIITDTPYCKFVFPKAYIWSGSYIEPYTEFEMPPVVSMIEKLMQTVEFVTDKDAAQIKKNINSAIRNGKGITPYDFMGNVDLCNLYGLMMLLKQELQCQCRNIGPRAFIGQDEISAEGYVMDTEFGTFKLVDRQRFSVANFNNSKFAVAS